MIRWHSLLVRLSVVVLFAFPSPSQSADPYVSVLWKPSPIPFPNVEKTENKPDRNVKLGLVEFDLQGISLSYQASQIVLDAGVLKVGSASFRLSHRRIVGKGPSVTFKTVRKEKKILGQRVVYDEPVAESTLGTLFTFESPTVVVEIRPGKSLALPLPADIDFDIMPCGPGSRHSIQIADADGFRAKLHESIETYLDDTVLDNAIGFRLENAPAELEGLLNQLIESEKGNVFRRLREELKKSVTSPQFVADLQKGMASRLPLLALEEGHPLRARLHLGGPKGEPTLLVAGESLVSAPDKLPEGFLARIDVNESGLGLMLEAYLRERAQSGKPARQIFETDLSDGAEEWVSLLSELRGTPIESKDVAGITVSFSPTQPAFQLVERQDSGEIRVHAEISLKSRRAVEAPIRVPVTLTLTVDSGQRLELVSVGIDKLNDSPSPVSSLSLRKVGAGIKLELLTVFLNQTLAKWQKGGVEGKGDLYAKFILPPKENSSGPRQPIFAFVVRAAKNP